LVFILVPMGKLKASLFRKSKFRTISVGIVGVALAGSLLAACGSAATSSTSSNSNTTTTTTKSSGASDSAFVSCLKSHGVTAPTGNRPPGGGGGAPPAGGTPPAGGFGGGNSKNSAAFKACASLRPAGSGGFGGGGFGGKTGAGSTALAAFRNCMSLHGVTVTKTSSTTPTTSISSNPKYAPAYAACQALLPSGSSTTTTG
jgi:hypothetical protein